jgi:hypothetical protein
METKIRFAKLTSLALLVATLTIYAASRTGAAAVSRASSPAVQTEAPEFVTFSCGGTGIGRGQTASIIAILIGQLDTERSVEVEFMFHDRDGNLLASSRQTLLPGHAASFDTRGIISILRQERTEIVGSLRVLVGANDPNVNLIIPKLEVFDNATGKTQIALYCRKAGRDA